MSTYEIAQQEALLNALLILIIQQRRDGQMQKQAFSGHIFAPFLKEVLFANDFMNF